MRYKITWFLLIIVTVLGCSSIEQSTRIDLYPDSDPDFKDLPFVQGYNSVNELVIKPPYTFPRFPGELEEEGVIRALVKVNQNGLPVTVRIVDHVSRFADSLSLDYLLGSSYYPPDNITNINGPYVMEFLIPIYNSEMSILDNTSSDSSSANQVRQYDTPPEPVGGYSAVQKAVIYPKDALENRIEGTVIISFVIDTFGKTGDYRILQSVGYGLNDAAIRAARNIQWEPASSNNLPVAVRISMPVVFRLRSG